MTRRNPRTTTAGGVVRKNGFYETALLWEAETSAWRMVVPQRFVNRLED